MPISTLSIHSFRGIPHELILDLQSEVTGTPVSMILFGDNGTGKSSVTDAIEFALQARIRGSKVLSQFAKSAISFVGEDLPSVRISLSDGTTVERSIVYKKEDEKNGLTWSDTKPHPKYSAVPFVLRRADILRFIEAPDNQRQLIFFDYFRTSDVGNWIETPSEIKTKLTLERTEKKQKRAELLSQFAEMFGVVEPIKPDISTFESLVREHVYDGLTKKEKNREFFKGNKPKINYKAKKLSKTIRELFAEIGRLNKQLSEINKSSGESPRDIFRKDLQEVFIRAGENLTKSFKEVSTNRFVEKIELIQGNINEAKMSLLVHLKNGKTCSPKEVFSEANLDLLALLIFLSIAQESAKRGQEKLLILDDVFQSVDSTIRFSVVDYILREFKDWQLILTVHDRLWQTQLRDLCRRYSHPFIEKEIVRWNFDTGPIILSARRDIDEPLLDGLNRGDISIICSQSGLLLEEICSKLSWILPITVTRRKEDKYTLGDLWPGVYKTLSKTNIKDNAIEVEKWIHLRNLVGAHYNEWSRSLSNHEATSFGEAVELLLWQVKCAKCFRWIESASSQNDSWSCRCGQIKIKRG